MLRLTCRYFRFLVLLTVLLGAMLLPTSVGAATTVLTSPAQFSGSETVIDFEGFALSTPLTTQYAAQGVTFLLANGLPPRISHRPPAHFGPRQFGPPGIGALQNFGPCCSDVVMTFTSPQDRVAFEIVTNASDDLNLVLTTVSDNTVVGTHFFVTGLRWKFVGLESDVPFDQVRVDVTSNVNQAMVLDNLRFELSVQQVDIDIKPGSDPNSINCSNEKGVVAVAILTTLDFDATTVDHSTVAFEGAGETHVNKKSGEPRRHEEDVDGDGDTDLVLHFRQGDTALTCASLEAALTGKTFGGAAIEGTDSVRMVGS